MLLKVIFSNLFLTLVVAHKEVQYNPDSNADRGHYYAAVHQNGNTHQYFINHGPSLPVASRLVASALIQNDTSDEVDDSGKQRVNIWSALEEMISTDPILSKTKDNYNEDDEKTVKQESYGTKRKAKKIRKTQRNPSSTEETNKHQYENADYSLYDANYNAELTGANIKEVDQQAPKLSKNKSNKPRQRPQEQQKHPVHYYKHDFYNQGEDEPQKQHAVPEKQEETETLQNSWNPIPSKNGPTVSKFSIGSYKNQLLPTSEDPTSTSTPIYKYAHRQYLPGTTTNNHPKVKLANRNATRIESGQAKHYYEQNPTVYEQVTHMQKDEESTHQQDGTIQNKQHYVYKDSEAEIKDEDVKYMPVMTQQEYDKYEQYLATLSPEDASKVLEQSNQELSNGWKATEHFEHAGQHYYMQPSAMDMKKYQYWHSVPHTNNERPMAKPENLSKRAYPYKTQVVPSAPPPPPKYNPKFLAPPGNVQYNYKPEPEKPVVLKDVELKLPLDTTNSTEDKVVIMKCLITSRTSIQCEIIKKPDELKEVSNGDVLKQMKDMPYIYEYIHPLIHNPELLPKLQEDPMPSTNVTEMYETYQPKYYTHYQHPQESQGSGYIMMPSGESHRSYIPASGYTKGSNEPPPPYLTQKGSAPGQYEHQPKFTRQNKQNPPVKRTYYPAGSNAKKVTYTSN